MFIIGDEAYGKEKRDVTILLMLVKWFDVRPQFLVAKNEKYGQPLFSELVNCERMRSQSANLEFCLETI